MLAACVIAAIRAADPDEGCGTQEQKRGHNTQFSQHLKVSFRFLVISKFLNLSCLVWEANAPFPGVKALFDSVKRNT